MAAAGWEMVRYADDFVILCRSRAEAEAALDTVKAWVNEAGLQLHPDKTRLTEASVKGGGFDFLGYHFERGHHWPREKSLKKIRETLRRHTQRNQGRSWEEIVGGVNRSLRRWTVSCANGCAACWKSDAAERCMGQGQRTSAGPMNGWPDMDFRA